MPGTASDAMADRLPGWSVDPADEFDLTFEPDPVAHDHATLGGVLGNNSCGAHRYERGWA